jgi:hypothetical protein
MKSSPYEPEPIEVRAEGGKPVALLLKKRSVKVRGMLNMWRIDEEWWRKPISRLYFLVELENGSRITLFRDLVQSQWYRQ